MEKSVLAVTHHIFLTKEQRYLLQKPGEIIEVIGASSPVWIKDAKWTTDVIDEVFCRYQLRHIKEEDANTVRVLDDGYLITLTGGLPKHLLNIKDGGIMGLALSHQNVIVRDEGPCAVLHCLSIEDISVLEQSIAVTEHPEDLAQTSV